MQVNSENLSTFLDTIPNCNRFLIAYSGGMDSHVLLHLMASLGAEAGYGIRAVHINHNIQPESRSWAAIVGMFAAPWALNLKFWMSMQAGRERKVRKAGPAQTLCGG